MSYDIYCYKPKSKNPSLEEAVNIIESYEYEDELMETSSLAQKKQLADVLITCNPRLEVFNLDYNEIAKLENSTVEEAKAKYTYIELNPPEEDLAIQLTIDDNRVSITIPYWYEGDKINRIFHELLRYLKVINKEAGYFVYDPQINEAFDPEKVDVLNLSEYQSVMGEIPEVVQKMVKKKSWWQFWN